MSSDEERVSDNNSAEIVSESDEYLGFPTEKDTEIQSDDSSIAALSDADEEKSLKGKKKTKKAAKGRKKKKVSEEELEEELEEDSDFGNEEESDVMSETEVEINPEPTDSETEFEENTEAGSGSEYEDNELDEPVGSGSKVPARPKGATKSKKDASIEEDADVAKSDSVSEIEEAPLKSKKTSEATKKTKSNKKKAPIESEEEVDESQVFEEPEEETVTSEVKEKFVKTKKGVKLDKKSKEVVKPFAQKETLADRIKKKAKKREPLSVISYPGETTVERAYLEAAAEIVAKDYNTVPYEESLIRATVNYKLKNSRYYSELNDRARNISKEISL